MEKKRNDRRQEDYTSEFVDTNSMRHKPADTPALAFHLPGDMHPAILSRLIYSYSEGYNFAVFPAMLLILCRKGLLDISKSDDMQSEYMPLTFTLREQAENAELPPYEKAMVDIFKGFGKGPVTAQQMEEYIRKHSTRVEKLLSHCAYTITQEVKEMGALETVEMPLQKGEHPPLSPWAKILMYLSLFMIFFAGAKYHILFPLAIIPVYFIFFRKSGQVGQRLTQEMEDIIVKWDGWYTFTDRLQDYPEQAAKVKVKEWDQALPYLAMMRKLEAFLKKLPEVMDFKGRRKELRGSVLEKFYIFDGSEKPQPDHVFTNFLEEFEKACIYVFYVSKSKYHDFSFKRK